MNHITMGYGHEHTHTNTFVKVKGKGTNTMPFTLNHPIRMKALDCYYTENNILYSCRSNIFNMFKLKILP